MNQGHGWKNAKLVGAYLEGIRGGLPLAAERSGGSLARRLELRARAPLCGRLRAARCRLGDEEYDEREPEGGEQSASHASL